MNLVLNARDAMDGRGTLTSPTENLAVAEDQPDNLPGVRMPPGRYVRLSVSDYRSRHGPRDPGARLRAVLHDQAARARAAASAWRRSTAS